MSKQAGGFGKTIWIVNPYGTLPSEGWREYRSLMLARELAALGFDVVWWISDFEHRSKRKRVGELAAFHDGLPSRIVLKIVPSYAYQRNISIGRIIYERKFGRAFRQMAEYLDPPAMIVVGDPAIFYGGPVLDYARSHGLKLIVDVLDLWPELFKILLPAALKRFQNIIFWPLYYRRRRLLAQAVGVVAVSHDFLDAVKPPPTAKTLVSYLGVNLEEFSRENSMNATDDLISEFRGDGLIVVYSGTLGDAYDIPCLLRAITLCATSGLNVKFVILGDGPQRSLVEAFAGENQALVRYLGTRRSEDLACLYKHCDIGLCSYVAGSTVSMPVKFYDYLAAGLCVMTSLAGESSVIVNRAGCGDTYVPGDSHSLFECIKRWSLDSQKLSAAKKNSETLSLRFDSRTQHRIFAEFVLSLV